MTTVMKASGPADLIGMVPALAGCAPFRSAVLLPFEGKRTYGAMRVDLPDHDDLAGFSAHMTGLVARLEGVDAVALLIFTDESTQPTGDGLVLPHGVLADLLVTDLEDTGLRMLEALCVTPSGWASYLDEDPLLEELPEPVAAGPLPAPAGDQRAGAELPAFDLAQKERVATAVSTLQQALDRVEHGSGFDDPGIDPRALEGMLLLDDIPLLAEWGVRLPEDPPPMHVAALLWLLERPLYRDALLLQWASDLAGGEAALADQFAYRADGTLPKPEHARVLIGEGPRPDIDRLHLALKAASALAGLAPKPLRVGPLAIAAWTSWALGNATHAAEHLDALREIDPEHSFGELLGWLMNLKALPDWAFASRADLADSPPPGGPKAT